MPAGAGARARRDVHRQRFRQRRLEQGWLLLLLLPPRLDGCQAPRPRSPAAFVQSAEQMEGGVGVKKEGYGLRVKKPGGTGVEGERFRGREPTDTSPLLPQGFLSVLEHRSERQKRGKVQPHPSRRRQGQEYRRHPPPEVTRGRGWQLPAAPAPPPRPVPKASGSR